MVFLLDRELGFLLGFVLFVLSVATAVGYALRKSARSAASQRILDQFHERTRTWWLMAAVFALALVSGGIGILLLFCLTSFLALREFLTIAPAKAGDQRVLFWTFFLVTPLQYALVAIAWYGLFSILIPVYAFLLVATLNVIVGDTESFLTRTAIIQWGLMVCVYCVSHAPALLTLHIPGYEGENAKLLVFLIVVVQMSEAFQYVSARWIGRTRIAPALGPNKTWEGLVGGVALATLLGAALWWATPFSPGQAAAMALVAALMGFLGGLTMSAIQRDRRDLGIDPETAVPGPSRVLDRIDSLCFAAPVFFHLTRFYFARERS